MRASAPKCGTAFGGGRRCSFSMWTQGPASSIQTGWKDLGGTSHRGRADSGPWDAFRPPGARRQSDYLSYYRRKSCVYALSILSVFDGGLEKRLENLNTSPRRPSAAFPFFHGFPGGSLRFSGKPFLPTGIYIRFRIKAFYEELFTLSTRFSTGRFRKNCGFPGKFPGKDSWGAAGNGFFHWKCLYEIVYIIVFL